MKNHLLVLSAVLATVLAISPAAQAQTATNTLERVSSFEYDADGLLIKEVVEPDRPNDCLQTTYVHDVYGNRVNTSSAACAGASGHTLSSAAAVRSATVTFAAQTITLGGTSYSVPAGAFATGSSNALGQSETKEFDPRHGGVIKLTGPNGGITTWTYDGFGRKTRENRADGTYSVWAYKLCQVNGQPRDALCPATVGGHALTWYVSEASHDSTGTLLAPIKYQFHDVLDRVVRVQAQDFHGEVVVQDTHYNALGQVSQKSILYRLAGGAPHWTTFTYDAIGRVLSETEPDGNGSTAVTQLAYNGLVTTATNPLGQTQTTHKNTSGQTIKIANHLGGEVLYSYDALGQLLQTNAAGSITKISYNRRGQKQSMQDPAMGAWDYAYNAFGELVWQQDSLNQTSSMVYDALGRMTQRTEPDLMSRWYFDARADGSACGAGIGKLCEATADNGYRRLHAYDAIGRPASTATTMDSASSLATVSETYHPQTGRLASKTWPTGYRATYTYNAQGLLSKVEGGGVAGHAQVVSLEVLAMDPQGRVTQYKQGNNVTTVKAYDQPTGKLNSVQATLQGQATGNVLNHGYGFDKLGNLLTRTDTNTGVTESFQYDALNRLSLYTALGGGLTSVQSVQTLYDATGNLKYKSDVGYYHYDPLRPNRLNQVTLAPESNWSAIGAVTQANTGTRTLSYAFDDTRPGTRSITTANGTQAMGNGNLWYTVSQDQVSGRHSVRWETYTSFNAPKEIHLGNLAPANFPSPATVVSYNCPPEHTLSGTNCTKVISTPTTTAATPQYSCPSGFTLSGTNCVKTNTFAASPYCTVPMTSLVNSNTSCMYTSALNHCTQLGAGVGVSMTHFEVIAYDEGGNNYGNCYFPVSHSCPAGTTRSGTSCLQPVSQAATLTYSCPAGSTLSGTQCNGTVTTTQAVAAQPVYSCPANSTLIGSNCLTTSTVAERTLSFAYGPEHQRIRQTVDLTSNSPSHMEAGTTWYLNGENSQGLSYEKEVKANGTIEHKHYVNAGGMSFALYVKREGNLNGKPATSISYFHQDHLGSIAVISNELGQVTERLAYDPWGRRRNVDGQTDINDVLYGVNTDRGYTMHEHLDEMGIIHMNGRIYDPLVGRFMSADPFIQAPSSLQSYNRYAYVLNNPLAYTDPSGNFWQIALYVVIGAEIAYQVGLIEKDFARMIQGIAAAAGTGNWAVAAGFGPITAGAMGGFAGGFVGSGGDLKSGLQGAFTGSLFGAAGLAGGPGEAGANSAARYLAHAAAGCVSAVAGGDKCGTGAAGALFGKFTSNQIAGWGGKTVDWVVARGVVTAVAGGVGSELTGGKFANGAVTAAYGYLFNQMSQAEAEAAAAERNRAVMSGACVVGFEYVCAGTQRPYTEAEAAAQREALRTGSGAVADKASTGLAMAAPFAGPFAPKVAGAALAFKSYAYWAVPPTPQEIVFDTIVTVVAPFATYGRAPIIDTSLTFASEVFKQSVMQPGSCSIPQRCKQ